MVTVTKPPKTSHIIVFLKSILSKHCFPMIRVRYSDKIELTKFDPYVQKFAKYKEQKIYKSLKP